MATIGIRNNNPCNLRPTGDKWQGMTGTNGGFLAFSSMIYGVRAGIVNMRTQINKNGLDTIEKYISVFAPPIENDTENYINFIARNSKIGRKEKISFNYETAKAIICNQTIIESQYQVSSDMFDLAWELATGEKKK